MQNIKTFILSALNLWAGSVDFNCIYLYVGFKAGDNSCKWKIFEQTQKVHYVETELYR